jgi:hypothetical protein
MWRRFVLAVSATLLLASCGTNANRSDTRSGAGPDSRAEQADAAHAGSGAQPAEGPHDGGHHQHHQAGDAAGPGAAGAASDDAGRAPVQACPERGHGPRPDAPLVRAARLPSESRAAFLELARQSERLPCGAVAEWVEHVRSGEHGVAPPQQPLGGADAELFARQWAAAVAASAELGTPELARNAGYAQVSPQQRGVGTHWINWTLVDAPFDPARPSMLLFDQTPGQPAHLIGFSYWVRSPSEPAGFAGPNDAWHSHLGLCFVMGTLYLEGVASALACPGLWLNGNDLWMLHAWVVPGMPNADGRFAPANPAIA